MATPDDLVKGTCLKAWKSGSARTARDTSSEMGPNGRCVARSCASQARSTRKAAMPRTSVRFASGFSRPPKNGLAQGRSCVHAKDPGFCRYSRYMHESKKLFGDFRIRYRIRDATLEKRRIEQESC